MKKNSILYVLFAMLFLTACIEDESDKITLDADGAYPYVEGIVNGFFDLADPANASSGFTVKTSASGATSVNSITVMKSFNGGAKVEHASISGTEGSVSVSLADAASGLGVDPATLALGDQFSFTFVLNTNDGRGLTSPVSVDVPMSCVSSLAGMYSATATYGYHDYLADFPTGTLDMVEIVEVSDGVYSISDLSAGLYHADGPYGVNYGTAGLAIEFRDICNNISWSGQEDAWGPCIPADGGVNSVDSGTGVITISWFCEAYGENGVTTLTPL